MYVCVHMCIWVCARVGACAPASAAPGPRTRVMSREAAAALMCRLGCRTELLQSRARAKVPTELGEERADGPPAPGLAQELPAGDRTGRSTACTGDPAPPPAPGGAHRATTRNWSICLSTSGLCASHTLVSSLDWSRPSSSPAGGSASCCGRAAGCLLGRRSPRSRGAGTACREAAQPGLTQDADTCVGTGGPGPPPQARPTFHRAERLLRPATRQDRRQTSPQEGACLRRECVCNRMHVQVQSTCMHVSVSVCACAHVWGMHQCASGCA